MSQKSKLENLSRVLQSERKELRDELERYQQHLIANQLPLPPWAADGDLGSRRTGALAAAGPAEASPASPMLDAADDSADHTAPPKGAVDQR